MPYQLEELSKLSGLEITVIKADTGVGEVRLTPSGSDVFKYNGASYSYLYLAYQGQSVTIIALPDGFYILSGVLQVVTGEPDIGGGRHPHLETVVNGADPAVTTDIVVTCTNTPDGVKKIYGYTQHRSTVTAGRVLSIKDSSANVWAAAQNPTVSIYGFTWFEVPLNSSKQFAYAVNNVDVDYVSIYQRGYLLGPV